MVRTSNRYLEGHWVWLPLGTQKILFLSTSTWERSFIIYTLSKSPIPFIKNCHVFSSCDRGDCTLMNGLFDYWGIGHIPGITSRFNIHWTQFMNVILRGTLHLVWLLYIGVQINAPEYFKDKNMYGCCSFQPFWLACHAPDKLKWGNYSNQCHWENSAHIDKKKTLALTVVFKAV